MPVYVFDGRTLQGARVSGERVADSKAALTALLQGAVRLPGQRVGVIVSGGNVPLATLAQILATPAP